MKTRYLPLICAVSVLLLSSGSPASSDCGHCYVKQAALTTLHKAEDEYLELLKKNADRLSSLEPGETSKAIKVQSNITMLNIQLESVRGNILSANVEIDKQCKECREPAGSETE